MNARRSKRGAPHEVFTNAGQLQRACDVSRKPYTASTPLRLPNPMPYTLRQSWTDVASRRQRRSHRIGSLGLLASCALQISPIAEAAQPLFTDDAAVVTPQTCQVEAWVRSSHDGREYWMQPACNPTGNVEIAVGLAHARPDIGESSSLVQLQAKTILFSLGDGEWSFGLGAGAGRDTQAPHGSSAFQLYYARALATWHPHDDLEIDLNLGAANLYGAGTFVLAGAAVQYAFAPNFQLLAEAFRDQPGNTRYQVGMRYVFVPNRFEAYVAYGSRFNAPSGQWSGIIGIRLQTDAFL